MLIQRGIAERERAVAEPERIRFRIGINLGDVIHEQDGDLYGDGVNVAARLEPLAEPGGVVVSGTAFDHLQGKLDLSLDFMGERQVKNIPQGTGQIRPTVDASNPAKEASPRDRVVYASASPACNPAFVR